MPDLDELTGFDPGLGAPMLPPSEIRRRGDRQRRRRTGLLAAGGALAVAVAIGAPVVALSGSDGHARETPSVDEPSDTQVSWLREIPRTLDVGLLPDDATFTFTPSADAAVDDFTMCKVPVFSTHRGDPAPIDTAGAYTGLAGTESMSARTVALYRDDAQAHVALQRLHDGVEGCPVDPNGSGATLVRRFEESPLPADESFVYSQRAQMDVDLLSDLMVFQVARIGNALYLAVESGGPGDEASVATEVQRLAHLSEPVLGSMDTTFSDDAVR